MTLTLPRMFALVFAALTRTSQEGNAGVAAAAPTDGGCTSLHHLVVVRRIYWLSTDWSKWNPSELSCWTPAEEEEEEEGWTEEPSSETLSALLRPGSSERNTKTPI